MRPPSMATRVPAASSFVWVINSTRATDAIDAKASPRKPRVPIAFKSSARLIFEVACRSNASTASSRVIPSPSSVIFNKRRPPDSTSITMRKAPASIAFSTSSLATDAGRSTTSPAAIRLEIWSGSTRILDIRGVYAGSADVLVRKSVR